MAKKRKLDTFSATKAVKANARERLGTPPPGMPIPDRRTKAKHGPEKHKQSVQELIGKAKRGEEV